MNEAGHPDQNSRLCEIELSGDEYLLWDAAVIDCAHFTTVALTSVGIALFDWVSLKSSSLYSHTHTHTHTHTPY